MTPNVDQGLLASASAAAVGAGWLELGAGAGTPRLAWRIAVQALSASARAAKTAAEAVSFALRFVLSWVRTLPGSQRLRALLVFDEVYGFLPPHPANPPTKRPVVALMKQARAFGVGVIVATQNPMDLDYRALSNAGLWCLGRLQTDADRARVDGLAAARGADTVDGGALATAQSSK